MNNNQILIKVKQYLYEKIKYYDKYLNYHLDSLDESLFAEYFRMKLLYREILRYIEELEKGVNE